MNKTDFVKATEAGWTLLQFAADVAENPRLQYEQLSPAAANRAYIQFDGSLILGCDNTRSNVANPLINAGLLERVNGYYARITQAGKDVLTYRRNAAGSPPDGAGESDGAA